MLMVCDVCEEMFNVKVDEDFNPILPNNGECCDEPMYLACECDDCGKILTKSTSGYTYKGIDRASHVVCTSCFEKVLNNVSEVAKLEFKPYNEDEQWHKHINILQEIADDLNEQEDN